MGQDMHRDHTPPLVKDTNRYRKEYLKRFVEKWDELIDWEQRAHHEAGFFTDLLKKRGVKKILDVATGTGFHSICLLKSNFDVTSVDGCEEMLRKAKENGRRRGHSLHAIQTDWRDLSSHVHERFDAIVCLGNSFTHLFTEEDRRKALAEFHKVLKPHGLLVLDQRNYDAIIDKGYRKGNKYYCGSEVDVRPEYIDDEVTRFRYSFPDRSVFYLHMYPLRKAYTQRLLQEAGFANIRTYGDFQEHYREEDTEFFIHVTEKPETNEEKHQNG